MTKIVIRLLAINTAQMIFITFTKFMVKNAQVCIFEFLYQSLFNKKFYEVFQRLQDSDVMNDVHKMSISITISIIHRTNIIYFLSSARNRRAGGASKVNPPYFVYEQGYIFENDNYALIFLFLCYFCLLSLLLQFCCLIMF